MGKLYIDKIVATQQFGSLAYDWAQKSPVDLRTVVEYESDLTNVRTWHPKATINGNQTTWADDGVYVYPGLKVFAMDTKEVYTLVTEGKEAAQLAEAVTKFTKIDYYTKTEESVSTTISANKYNTLTAEDKDGYIKVDKDTGYGWRPEGSQGLDTAAVNALITSLLLQDGKIKPSLYDKGDGLKSVAVIIPSDAQQLTFKDTQGKSITPNEHTYYTLAEAGEVGNIQYSVGSIFIYNNKVSKYILITDNSIGEVVSDITSIKGQLSWKDLPDMELTDEPALILSPNKILNLKLINYTNNAYTPLIIALEGNLENTISFKTSSINSGTNVQNIEIPLSNEQFANLKTNVVAVAVVYDGKLSNTVTINKDNANK